MLKAIFQYLNEKYFLFFTKQNKVFYLFKKELRTFYLNALLNIDFFFFVGKIPCFFKEEFFCMIVILNIFKFI